MKNFLKSVFNNTKFLAVTLNLVVTLGILFLSSFISPASAQTENRHLVISDRYQNHYIAPYLNNYSDNKNIKTIRDIIFDNTLVGTLPATTGSMGVFKIKNKHSWVGFDILNKSSTEIWYLDFGSFAKGRFGFFNGIEAYVIEGGTGTYKQYSLEEDNRLALPLPIDQKSRVVLKLSKDTYSSITTPLKLVHNAKISKSNFNLTQIMHLFLYGMISFFAAIALTKQNYRFLLFSIYYGLFFILIIIQNSFVNLPLPFLGGVLQFYLFYAISLVAALIALCFNTIQCLIITHNPRFYIPALIGAVCIGLSPVIYPINPLASLFLGFGPSLLILIVITFLSVIGNIDRQTDSNALMMGWFVLLFGGALSILALSDTLLPVSSAINAYLIALIPQAFFFAVFAKSIYTDTEPQQKFLRSIEINESETVSKLKQTQDQTQHDRLLKVIEQERKVLSELRKSEARQTEEMRKAKELADEANKGKSAFLAVISHEIRTPMTGVMGMVKMLLNSNLTKEQYEYAQTIQDSADAMLALLNDILDFEKIEQGKLSVEQISFDLPRLIQGVQTLMRGHAVQKNLDLDMHMSTNLPKFVIGDPTRLRQVLLNLTGNAIKFTEKGKVKITVQMMKHNSNKSYEIYFGVSDNGIGISEEAKKKIFTPFSQADKSIARKFGGTGLGLAISKGLIHAMGSEININSQEGEGSTFFFTLNMKEGKSDISYTAPTVQEFSLEQHSKEKPREVLLVDDNEINRKVVKSFIKAHPFTITESVSAEDCFKKLTERKFDSILMDIELPGINGDEATNKIRNDSNSKNQNTPIIAITGNSQQENLDSYLQVGMDDYIIKPIKPEDLLTKLTKYSFGTHHIKKTNPDVIKNVLPSSSVPKIALPSMTEDSSTHSFAPSPIKFIDLANVETGLQLDDGSAAPQTLSPKKDMMPLPLTKEPATEPVAQNHPAFDISPPPSASVLPPPPPPAAFNTIEIRKEPPPPATPEIVLDLEILNSLKKHLSIEKLDEMLVEALNKAEEIISNIQESLQTTDTVTITRLCHDLKGMAGNFGMKELSEAARDLEKKSKTQPQIVLAGLISKLPIKKERAQSTLSEWLNS